MSESPLHDQVCQLRYCRVVSALDTFPFTYRGAAYELRFTSPLFERGRGFVVHRVSDELVDHVDSGLLLWLLVYFGEDTLSPSQEVDTRLIYIRGDFTFAPQFFQRFLRACERFPGKSLPKWRRALFDRALTYFNAAVRGGLNYMPVNLGFFGMCLECIGNFHHGKRDAYFTLGNMRFLQVMRGRLRRYKEQPSYREATKRFERRMIQDVQLLHELRNAFYGHSLLHKTEDRRRLAGALRSWFQREVRSQSLTRISFPVSGLEAAVGREAPALYKLGLRACRTFLLMLLGFTRSLPFATHDFSVIGDLRIVRGAFPKADLASPTGPKEGSA